MNLLLIPCSSKKVKYLSSASAVFVYDGPTYRVIRKAIAEKKTNPQLKTLILSSQYGLLRLFDPIYYYDEKLTQAKAFSLIPRCSDEIKSFLKNEFIKKVFLALSKTYLIPVEAALKESGIPLFYEKRGLGYKLQFVKKVFTGEIQ